jgi:hypothetical protein
MREVARWALGALLVGIVGCGGGESRGTAGTETGATDTAAAAPVSTEFDVASVMIGKRIGDNNLITEPTFQFLPQDTVYVSVGTTGVTDSTTLTAVWHFQTGQTIDSTARTISTEGPQNTEFHVSREKGWQVGTYKVTLYADGDSVDARTFAVRKQ